MTTNNRLHNDDDVEKVEATLSDGIWRKSNQIKKLCGVSARDLRSMALETGKFIGSVHKGYKLTVLATDQEIDAFNASMASRVKNIYNRMDRVKKLHAEKHYAGSIV